MKISVLFFAAHRDLVGTSELEMDLPPSTTAGELIQLIRERGTPWSSLPPEPAIAVNQSFAEPTTVLGDGDEVALIPPVSGG